MHIWLLHNENKSVLYHLTLSYHKNTPSLQVINIKLVCFQSRFHYETNGVCHIAWGSRRWCIPVAGDGWDTSWNVLQLRQPPWELCTLLPMHDYRHSQAPHTQNFHHWHRNILLWIWRRLVQRVQQSRSEECASECPKRTHPRKLVVHSSHGQRWRRIQPLFLQGCTRNPSTQGPQWEQCSPQRKTTPTGPADTNLALPQRPCNMPPPLMAHRRNRDTAQQVPPPHCCKSSDAPRSSWR